MSKTAITVDSYLGSPNKINPETKIICNGNGRYYRGVETKDFIYFCNYQESDDNANVKMYRKSDLSLVCDNYHASNDLQGVLIEKTYTYLSKSMKYNAKAMQEQEA